MPTWVKYAIIGLLLFSIVSNAVAWKTFATTEFGGLFTLVKTLFSMK
jgi:hypothetical protein